mgnify:FL=1
MTEFWSNWLACRCHAELASAVELVVETVFADDFITAFLQAALAPVHRPPGHGRKQSACIGPGSIDLIKVFPAGRGERRGQNIEAVFLCITGGTFKPELETFSTSGALLRLMLKTPCNAAPLVMGIAIIGRIWLKSGCRYLPHR